MVSLVLDDPAVQLFGNEPLLVDGRWVGYVRAAGYGYTLGGAVGLAVVDHADGVTAEWLASTTFVVDCAEQHVTARLSLKPPYDPTRSRILA